MREGRCLLIVIAAVAALVGCSPLVVETQEVEMDRAVEGASVAEDQAQSEPAQATVAVDLVKNGADSLNIAGTPIPGTANVRGASRANRLIIKNAELRLSVEDTDIAIDRVAQTAADSGGYIISSRVRYEQAAETSYKHASITLAVPVDEFEHAMRRLRNLAIQVVDETASGQDVTDEYVDLESRLRNLEATRDRIREFLDQAETVEESLRVNEELSTIEAEIEQVRGRMNYLFDRASYSTITVHIDPEKPTPTPTPTATPEPPWSPAPTIRQAGKTLTEVVQALIEIGIWLGIVVLPILAPPILIAVGIYAWAKRRRARGTEPHAPSQTEPDQE